jgi:hypothetical protein
MDLRCGTFVYFTLPFGPIRTWATNVGAAGGQSGGPYEGAWTKASTVVQTDFGHLLPS